MSNIVGGLKTIEDYANARQATQNALQTSQLDNLSKQNIYATQLLSGAAATGDQGAYDNALKNLQSNGVDTSAWAPDIATGAKQAAAARLAQSPLGSLLNAGLKEQSNAIQLNPQTGTISPTSMGQGGILGALGGQVAPDVTKPWVNPDLPQNPVVTNSPLPTIANNAPIAAPAAQYTTPAPTPQQTGGFIPPTQLPNEPVPTYRSRVDQAFAQYKESPQAVRANAAAGKQGDADIANQEAANKAQGLTDRLTQNLQAMLKLNDSVPQSGFVPASVKAYVSQGLHANPSLSNIGLDTSGNAATSYDQWKQIDLQQTLNEMQQFLAAGGGGAKLNQTIDKAIQKATSIDVNGSPETRKAQIVNALAELSNKNVGAANLVRNNQGQPTQPYAEIPVTIPSKSEQVVDGSGVNTAPPQKGEVRNGYLFMGGNPNDKNSYKKVGQ